MSQASLQQFAAALQRDLALPNGVETVVVSIEVSTDGIQNVVLDAYVPLNLANDNTGAFLRIRRGDAAGVILTQGSVGFAAAGTILNGPYAVGAFDPSTQVANQLYTLTATVVGGAGNGSLDAGMSLLRAITH